MQAEFLRIHLSYKEWQGKRLIAAVRVLPTEIFEAQRGSSHGGIKGTLQHIYSADFAWLRRVQGLTVTRADVKLPETVKELEDWWTALLGDWKEWGNAVADAAWTSVLDYSLFNGTPCSTPLWQIVLHVVNHGTHHGGQVVAMLRQAGITPPPTDAIVYYRELDAKAVEAGSR
ncbi:MAG TPA: DinB family protein [Candidatus Angelobacter sp.]|nr:DinB family protein [Candidatus Angelobacter sp.]